MKIQTTTITRLTLTNLENHDPIAVYVENFGEGAGKITITCWDYAWTNYWSHMGPHSLEEFFIKASPDYLVGKLKTGIRNEIDDEDLESLQDLLKKEIIKQRRALDLSHERARELWGDVEMLWGWDERADICSVILGDEWWHCTPKKPNPEYEHLTKVVGFVKEAFAQQARGC